MALLATFNRIQRNSQRGLKTRVRPLKDGESRGLPEKPYWKDADNKIDVKGFDEIPGPKPIFFLGNIWRYWPIVGQYSFHKLHETYSSFFKQYGYVVKEKVHSTRTIVHLYHPEDIMSVYKCVGKFPLRKSHSAMAKYRRDRPHLYTSAGLGSSNGEEWLAFRKQFLAVHSPTIIAAHRPKVEAITDELVERLGRGLGWKNEIDVRQPLFRWALETVGMVTLNRRLGCLDPETNAEADRLIKAAHATHDAIYRVENHMSPLVRWREYRRLVRAQDFFSEVIRTYMFQALADTERKSLLSVLYHQENKEITTSDIFTLILDLFQGGIHSVSYSISFALLHLAMNKDKQNKLRERLIEALPTLSSLMCEAKGPPVKYLTDVVKESLRLSPPTIGTGRILSQDLVLGGYNVPAGTMVILHNQISSMQPEFFKDPHVFNPERFSVDKEKDLGVDDNVGKFAYQPFGFGMRACIGLGFAKMEMNLALAKIVRNYEISYHHEPVGIVNKLHNEPDRPVLLRFTKVDH